MSGQARIKWCDKSEDGMDRRAGGHEGPIYTVTVIAVQVGPGTGKRNRKRVVMRKTLARLCEVCLMRAEFSVQGESLFSREAKDPAAD